MNYYNCVRLPVTLDSSLNMLVTELIVYSSCLFPLFHSFLLLQGAKMSFFSQRLALGRQLSLGSNIVCLWLWPYETLSLEGKSMSEEMQLRSIGWRIKYLFYIVAQSMRHTFEWNLSCAFFEKSVESVVAWKWREGISVFSCWWNVTLKITYSLSI